MSRRRRAEKREVVPDSVYKSETLGRLINKIMLNGKKSLAEKIVYGALDRFLKKIKSDNPLEAFNKALDNAKPALEVKSRRIGGATYQVPVEILPHRREALAMRWIINYSRAKSGRSMEEALAGELTDCYNNQGSSIKKKDDTHRMAESNKAHAHYKW